MNFDCNINKEKMKSIRSQVVEFHLESNKNLYLFLRILIILCAITVLYVNFSTLNIVFALLVFGMNIFMLKSIQLFLAKKRIDRFYNQNLIETVNIHYEINEKITIIASYKNIVKKVDIDVHTIQTSQFIPQEQLIIYTTGKIITNFSKSRPRYIYMANLDEQEKQTLVALIQKNSCKVIVK